MTESKISRRQVLTDAATIAALGMAGAGITLPTVAFSDPESGINLDPNRVASWLQGGGNVYMAFNNIHDPEGGESDEFTTIADIERLARACGATDDHLIFGIGARSGTADNIYGKPGEMAFHWRLGDAWSSPITSNIDASPVSFGKDDPIIVCQIGILNPTTALKVTERHARGSVLWTFYNDATTHDVLWGLKKMGLHNSFDDVDGGATNALFQASQLAHTDANSWQENAEQYRDSLQKFIPELSSDESWQNFASTLGAAMAVQSHWLKAIHEKGWAGAAIRIRGKIGTTLPFHLQEWNRISPQDPEYVIGRGKHRFALLHVQFGREVRPYVAHADGTWELVGFLYNPLWHSASGTMAPWSHFGDIFGQWFHIHGFSRDLNTGGHALAAIASGEEIEVELFPLPFDEGLNGFRFNTNIKIDKSRSAQTADGLVVTIKNEGHTSVRNLAVGLSDGWQIAEEKTVSLLTPGESVALAFKSEMGRTPSSDRRVIVDLYGKMVLSEGNQMDHVVFL